MSRHRGVYNPDISEPYELSRYRIENYIRCPACFYLMQVRGIKFPSIPGYNINEATDILLKKNFDIHRSSETCHPFLENLGMGYLVPFQHSNFELWTQSMHFGAEGRFHTIHKSTNLKVGGGLDDVWFNTKTGQVHLVDYKSTSQKSPGKKITLDDWWKASYKRQMDFYIWVMNRLKIDTSNIGYFLYCDGDRFTDKPFLNDRNATMEFKISLITYESDFSWVEPTLRKIKKLLNSPKCPEHSKRCEHGAFLKACLSS
jgi:hypothetical protein